MVTLQTITTEFNVVILPHNDSASCPTVLCSIALQDYFCARITDMRVSSLPVLLGASKLVLLSLLQYIIPIYTSNKPHVQKYLITVRVI